MIGLCIHYIPQGESNPTQGILHMHNYNVCDDCVCVCICGACSCVVRKYVYIYICSHVLVSWFLVKKKILKPTFSERVISVTVSFGNFHAWQWGYTAEAVDEATGISAKAQNYQSKSGAKKHALENLKAILLDRGIIRPDDI